MYVCGNEIKVVERGRRVAEWAKNVELKNLNRIWCRKTSTARQASADKSIMNARSRTQAHSSGAKASALVFFVVWFVEMHDLEKLKGCREEKV